MSGRLSVLHRYAWMGLGVWLCLPFKTKQQKQSTFGRCVAILLPGQFWAAVSCGCPSNPWAGCGSWGTYHRDNLMSLQRISFFLLLKCPESDFFFLCVISFVILGSSNQVRAAWTLCIWVRERNHYCVFLVLRVDLIILSHFQPMQEAFFFLTHLARNITTIFMGLLQKNVLAAVLNIPWQQSLWCF